jgi:hypothetical protein
MGIAHASRLCGKDPREVLGIERNPVAELKGTGRRGEALAENVAAIFGRRGQLAEGLACANVDEVADFVEIDRLVGVVAE